MNILYGLLHHSAAITVLWQINELGPDRLIQSLLLLFSSPLKYLLEDIVAESVLHQGLVFFENEGENEFLGVFLTSFKHILHRPGPVLVLWPLPHLWQVADQLLFRGDCRVVVLIGHADHLVAHVVLVLQTQSRVKRRGTFLWNLLAASRSLRTSRFNFLNMSSRSAAR